MIIEEKEQYKERKFLERISKRLPKWIKTIDYGESWEFSGYVMFLTTITLKKKGFNRESFKFAYYEGCFKVKAKELTEDLKEIVKNLESVSKKRVIVTLE